MRAGKFQRMLAVMRAFAYTHWLLAAGPLAKDAIREPFHRPRHPPAMALGPSAGTARSRSNSLVRGSSDHGLLFFRGRKALH